MRLSGFVGLLISIDQLTVKSREKLFVFHINQCLSKGYADVRVIFKTALYFCCNSYGLLF